MSSLGSRELTLTVSSLASALLVLSGTSLLSLTKLSGSGLTFSSGTSSSSGTVVRARSKLTLLELVTMLDKDFEILTLPAAAPAPAP
jgi:hypothetical protein